MVWSFEIKEEKKNDLRNRIVHMTKRKKRLEKKFNGNEGKTESRNKMTITHRTDECTMRIHYSHVFQTILNNWNYVWITQNIFVDLHTNQEWLFIFRLLYIFRRFPPSFLFFRHRTDVYIKWWSRKIVNEIAFSNVLIFNSAQFQWKCL